MADSVVPSVAELRPLSTGEVSRIVAERFAAGGRPLRIVGGRTALPPGEPSPAACDVLSTAGLTRVIDHPARDMTITVEAGIRIDDLREQLARENQRLPIDVPEGHRATLGGAIATNTSGPGRFGHGTFRDYVIGIRAVDGRGRTFAAGGRVVKNVAGYDLCKLMVGSHGTLAVLTEVTLKVRPIPESRRLIWCEFADFASIDRVLERLLTSETRPVALDVFDPLAAGQVLTEAKLPRASSLTVLCIAFEGTAREAAWQADVVQRELQPHQPVSIDVLSEDDADRTWSAMAEYQTASDDPLTFQASLRPSRTMEFLTRAAEQGVALQAHAGNGVVIGHLPDDCANAAAAERILAPLADLAAASAGSLRVLECDRSWCGALARFLRPTRTKLAERLRRTFDPKGLLNPDVG